MSKEIKTEADELPALIVKVEKLREEKKLELARYNEEIAAYETRIREIAHSADQILMSFNGKSLAE